jgi:uncharacterized protein YkwD/LysM repeat protein
MHRNLYLKSLTILAVGLSLLVVLFINPASARAADSAANAYDLIAAVNGWRASAGLPPYNPDGSLMAAAQGHSEYQASIGTWSHAGAGGTYEWDRAAAAGYGGGQSIKCDEAVAIASTSKDANYVVYTLWNDYDHRDLVLLNPNYTDVGAAAVEKDGLVYYTLDACYTGAGASNAPANQNPATPAATRPAIIAIQTSTPNPDGSVIHKVQFGQTMWGIAIEYGMKITQIAGMNNLDPANPIIWPGQDLLILPPATATITASPTATTPPPTRTPKPSVTPTPTRPTATPTLSPTPTQQPFLGGLPVFKPDNSRVLGIVMIAICGLGLVAVLIGSLRSKSG